MKKGHSYIYADDTNVNHPLIKALKQKGINDIELIYASQYSTYAGWMMVKCDKIMLSWGGWLGFTKKEALINIEKKLILKDNEFLYFES